MMIVTMSEEGEKKSKIIRRDWEVRGENNHREGVGHPNKNHKDGVGSKKGKYKKQRHRE
jgi:hypothetical protein